MNLNELFKAKSNAKAKAEGILTAAQNAGRALTTEESAAVDACIAEVQALEATIEKAQAVSNIKTETFGQKIVPTVGKSGSFRASEDYTKAFDQYARRGMSGMEYGFGAVLNEGVDAEGKYLVPTTYESAIISKVAQTNVMRQLATVRSFSTNANIPVQGTVPTAAWTAESAAYNESDASFAQAALAAHKLTVICKVSEELLQDAVFPIESHLADVFGQAFGNAEETAFVNGSGNGQPKGVAADSTKKIDAASQTAITADEIVGLYHGLAAQYRRNASWLMKDSTALIIRKLVDSNGVYVWQPGLQAGTPDMLLGRPVYTSEGMDAAAAGKKAVLFGDMSFYLIGDRGPRAFQRLNELYAANGQVGFKMSERVDGKLTLAEAVVNLTMKA